MWASGSRPSGRKIARWIPIERRVATGRIPGERSDRRTEYNSTPHHVGRATGHVRGPFSSWFTARDKDPEKTTVAHLALAPAGLVTCDLVCHFWCASSDLAMDPKVDRQSVAVDLPRAAPGCFQWIHTRTLERIGCAGSLGGILGSHSLS